MSATWGRNFKVTIFGESHGAGIGVVIDGVPSGLMIDNKRMITQMERRRPGRDEISTPRTESDLPETISGVFDGKTTGAPLCAMIRNNDTRSHDYEATKDLIRPGHADFTAHVKFGGHNDHRGGGHFSGRLTAGLVYAGTIALQVLDGYGISIGAHISSISDIRDIGFDLSDIGSDKFKVISEKRFPVIDDTAGVKMISAISAARDAGDSVGGVIECAAAGLPAGLGEPFFDSVESLISHLAFSIPGVKGVEFGGGFAMSAMKGSSANDTPYMDDCKISTRTNYSGGVNGGITNSMPVVFRVAVKPTSSISRRQDTVDFSEMRDSAIEIRGRHDPCIVPRAVPVVECAAAIAILDMLMSDRAVNGGRLDEKH